MYPGLFVVLLHAQKIPIDLTVTDIAGRISFWEGVGGGGVHSSTYFANVFTEATMYGD